MNLQSINRFSKLSLLFAVLQLSNTLYAQSICYGFESTCDAGGPAALEPFFSGCVPDWNSAYGTPDLRQGSAFIGFWHTCGGISGEGIVLENIPFTDCVDIQFNYQVYSTTNISKYKIQLFAISGPFPGATASNICDGIIADPGNLDHIWETTGEELQIGQNYAVSIDEATIPEDTKQLWFRIAPLENAELADGDQAGILIDDFCYLACDFCEDMVGDALFDIETDVDQGVYTLYPEGFESYEDVQGEHSWQVLTSGTEGGPYQSLGIFATEDFPIVMEEGLFYTVIHTVNYLCGEFCYLKRACSTIVLCDDCGPIDCDAEFDFCSPKGPTGLECTYDAKEGTILTWNATSDAASYQVDFVEVTGDPFSTCSIGASGSYGPTVDANVMGNSIPAPTNISQCYDFRVRAICNGSPGEWSIWYHVTGPCQSDPGEDEPGFPGGFKLQGVNGNHTIVYPNPSAAFFNIVLPQSEEAAKVQIFDFSGREVYKKVLESSKKEPLTIRWTPSSTQNKGIYLVLIEQGKNRTTHKLILE